MPSERDVGINIGRGNLHPFPLRRYLSVSQATAFANFLKRRDELSAYQNLRANVVSFALCVPLRNSGPIIWSEGPYGPSGPLIDPFHVNLLMPSKAPHIHFTST